MYCYGALCADLPLLPGEGRGEVLRHRVVPAPAPRVTAANTFGGEPETFEQTILFKCFQSILAAGGRIPARRAQPGRNSLLVKPNDEDKRDSQYMYQILFHEEQL